MKVKPKKATNSDDLFPHGVCECDGPTCCRGRGPAAFRVTRQGQSMLVCTRCDLSSDADKTLLVTKDEQTAKVYFDFDPLGALCLGFALSETDAPASPREGDGSATR